MSGNEAALGRICERVLAILRLPTVPLEASGRHAHLTREAVDALFGKGYQLTPIADLSQPGQFVCKERIRAVGPKGEFPSVVVLGPERPASQMELSLTDALVLGLKVPVRLSGDIANTPGLRLIGPAGEYEMPSGLIVAERHIHMTPEDAARWNLLDGQTVSVRVFTERPVTFHGVALRVSPKFRTYMHIDYDEANACGFSKGMAGFIVG